MRFHCVIFFKISFPREWTRDVGRMSDLRRFDGGMVLWRRDTDSHFGAKIRLDVCGALGKQGLVQFDTRTLKLTDKAV